MSSTQSQKYLKMMQTPEEDDDRQDALKAIRVLLEREKTSYSIPHSSHDDESAPKSFSTFLKPTHRQRMVEWCFALVETMELRRETIERAINCIDRFILLNGGKILLSDPILYQRAVITALYLMIKCHEEEAIPIEDMAYVCSGGDEKVDEQELDYASDQLAAMEIVLLTELDWCVNPPTSYEYLVQFLKLLNFPLTDEFDPVYEIEEREYDESSDNVVAELRLSDLNESSSNSLTRSEQPHEQADSDTQWLMELAFFEVQESLKNYDSAKKGAFCNAYNAIMEALPMLDGGVEMADRLEALLCNTVSDFERYRSSDSSSNTSTATTSHLSSSDLDALEKEAEFFSELLDRQKSSDNIRSVASSDDSIISESSEEHVNLPEEEEEEEDTVETIIEINYIPGSTEDKEMFRSRDGSELDLKLDLEDNESPSCVMDRGLSTMLQASLVAETSDLLDG